MIEREQRLLRAAQSQQELDQVAEQIKQQIRSTYSSQTLHASAEIAEIDAYVYELRPTLPRVLQFQSRKLMPKTVSLEELWQSKASQDVAGSASADDKQFAREPACTSKHSPILQTNRIAHPRHTTPVPRVWTVAEGLSNGQQIGQDRLERNSRGYPLDKEVWARVGMRMQKIIRIPYIKEKYLDKSRNQRFEATRNPSRNDVLGVAHALIEEIQRAGITDADIVLVPRRQASDMRNEPMGSVAKVIEEMSGSRLRLNCFLSRRKLASPPSRTSIFDQHPDSDLTKVFSGVDNVFHDGATQKISRFAGDSNFIDRLDEYGLGRNRAISEDYGTLTWQDPPPAGSTIVLLDDSVGQGTSQVAAALAIHKAVPSARVSPLTYWAFANAPLRPKMSLSLNDRVDDIVLADERQLARAIERHYEMAQEFVSNAEAWAKEAERIMRDDPVGNWLGGLFTGQSDYDQQKARRILSRHLLDPRQREVAVRLATSRVDHSNRSYHQQLLQDLTRDPAAYSS